MYDRASNVSAARGPAEASGGSRGEVAARLALDRVRQVHTACNPEDVFRSAGLREALAGTLADPGQEAERLFALGWLRWLDGEPIAAEALFAETARRAREQGATERLAEAAYWGARAGLRLGRAEALTGFEGVLRTLGGSPQATAWFVDLLWRAGRGDRAEQVWKSVRGNRRVLGCPEGPLLEARPLLRRGEMAPAERLLRDAAPASGVVWVECRLLLAWALAGQKQGERALDLLEEARRGPYPAPALEAWEALCALRLRGGPGDEAEAPAFLGDFLRGQQARREGRLDEAAACYRAALAVPAVAPFARYALAVLGQEDPAAVLAGQPGLFLAVRCRVRQVLERFRQRQASSAECLDALRQAAASGYRSPAADHFRRLAQALDERRPGADDVRDLAAEAGAKSEPSARNLFRVALEQAVHRLPPAEALDLLQEWARSERTGPDERALLGRQMLRLAVRDGKDVPATVDDCLPGDPLVPLARALLHPDTPAPAEAIPVARLWRAAQALANGLTPGGEEEWRDEVRRLREQPRLRSAAQALLLYEAAGRNDADAVARLLDEVDAWRGFPKAPPAFVLRALEAVVAGQPAHPAWRRSLARWLPCWDMADLGSAGQALAALAGLVPPGEVAEPPTGMPVVPWLLHQTARALGRADPAQALACVRRALDLDPERAALPEAEVVRAALPELERRARAQHLAAVFPAAGVSAVLLVDAVDLLAELPSGPTALEAAARGDAETARAQLALLAAAPELPRRLAHHLALLAQREALALEEQDHDDRAEPCWRTAWDFWFRYLAGTEAAPERDRLLTWLLGRHRQRINDLLARNAVDGARRTWTLVAGLPERAEAVDAGLGRDLAGWVARFREELATEYLLTTREAMRHGDIPEGWRADYEKGLVFLRRLLSLDRDNLRLLTALVEVCGAWFLDLYNASDPGRLIEQVERFTPFALQLARLVEGCAGELPARAALSDFCKFRGFVARDRAHKAALYREALRFNPAHANVRDLLAELGEPAEAPPESTP